MFSEMRLWAIWSTLSNGVRISTCEPRPSYIGSEALGSDMACEKCADLCLEYEIHTSGDLRKAFAVVRDNLADHTIQQVSGSDVLSDIKSIEEGGGWPDDYLSCRFKCTNCGELFNLDAETYHGSGGQWVQTSNSYEAKLQKRIIGYVPGLSSEDWLQQHKTGFLLVTGVVVFSVLLVILFTTFILI